jgi:hypothetical protein
LRVRLVRSPLVHFVAGGALLFVANRAAQLRAAASAPVEPVVISAADVAQLKNAYTTETGLTPSAVDEAALVDDAIDEELLFREAVARGLDRNDRAVRNWLVEQMRILSDDPGASEQALYARALQLGLDRQDLVVRRILIHKVRLLVSRIDEREATDDELRAYYARHASDGRLPQRVSFWHVFLAANERDRDALLRAEQQLAMLRERRPAPRDAVREGDSFALPSHLVAQSHAQLDKVFGASFADAVLSSPENAWSGPIASPFGLHLVWVEQREPGDLPPFADVRGRVLESWREEQRGQRLTLLLRTLRARYPLDIASDAWREHQRHA